MPAEACRDPKPRDLYRLAGVMERKREQREDKEERIDKGWGAERGVSKRDREKERERRIREQAHRSSRERMLRRTAGQLLRGSPTLGAGANFSPLSPLAPSRVSRNDQQERGAPEEGGGGGSDSFLCEPSRRQRRRRAPRILPRVRRDLAPPQTPEGRRGSWGWWRQRAFTPGKAAFFAGGGE
jgi:hypothetical protein